MTPDEARIVAEAAARIVAWLRSENGACDCFAREAGECACGAWDDYKTMPLLAVADMIENGDHRKGTTNGR